MVNSTRQKLVKMKIPGFPAKIAGYVSSANVVQKQLSLNTTLRKMVEKMRFKGYFKGSW